MSRKKSQILGQDTEDIVSGPGLKGKKKTLKFSVFGISYERIDPALVKRHLAYLVLIAILAKFIVIFATTAVFHSFIDYFDFQYYLQGAINILQGQVPYADFNFSYPPLAFVPIFLAFIPALLLQNGNAFVLSFQFLMVICDIIIVICIYLIGLKLYNEKTAFIAAFLYATAFSVAYFVLTKYDAFPTCILMLAVLFTVYNRNIRGYLALVLGFLAKIFPVIVLPFTALYNAKSTSLKQEIISILKIGIPVAVVCLVPVLVLKPEIILSYFSGSLVRTDVYVNTATYTLYAYLHDIMHLGISAATVSSLMYLLMGLLLLFLVAIAYIEPEKDTRFLVKLLAVSIFVVIFCMKYHSPQYIVWFTPFVCLLVADSLYGIILFYVTQAITYFEFPLAFGTLYLNVNYVGETGTSVWYLALVFFTVNFVAYILLMYLAVKPTGSHARMLFGKIREKLVKKS
jgi:hypothetical protein